MIELADMNRTVLRNLIVGEWGRIAGVVCLGDQSRFEPVHDGTIVKIESVDGGDFTSSVTGESGFFISDYLLAGEYYVSFERAHYQSTFERVTVESFRDVVLNRERQCNVVLEPI